VPEWDDLRKEFFDKAYALRGLDQLRLKTHLINGQELPWTPGEHEGPDVYVKDIVPATTTPRFSGNAVNAYKDGMMLYSPGILPVTGYDPVKLYWGENAIPLDELPFLLPLKRRALFGVKEPFDRVLFAAPYPRAHDVDRALSRTAYSTDGKIWKAVHQLLIIDDPDADPGTLPDRIPVHVFGLKSDDMGWLWHSTRTPADRLVLRLKKVTDKLLLTSP